MAKCKALTGTAVKGLELDLGVVYAIQPGNGLGLLYSS